MKINVIELHESNDSLIDTTLIQVDERLLITVIGFGCSEYRWKVINCGENEGNPVKNLVEIFGPQTNGFWNGTETLGKGMVWVGPVTFAHVVRDVIWNQ